MKSTRMLILISWLVAPSIGLADDALVREFQAIERDRAEALRTGDAAAVDRLYADDFVGVSRTGQIVRKPELLRVIRERGVNDLTFTMRELEVRLLNDLAFVLGRLVGKDASGKVIREGRVLHVYGRRGNRWRMVSAQATPIPG